MATPKGERNISKEEFDAIYYRICDDAEDMITHNFRASKETAYEHQIYIAAAAKALRAAYWDLVYHIKVANALYPTTTEELTERRIHQETAIGICFDIQTLYELVLHKLKVKNDMGVVEIKHVQHQINAIRAWRKSDNRRFKHLREQEEQDGLCPISSASAQRPPCASASCPCNANNNGNANGDNGASNSNGAVGIMRSCEVPAQADIRKQEI